jgi:two-component system KDP operon response regulator KdpE
MNEIKSKILVVDDEEKLRKLLKITLENSGFNYVDSSNGTNAISLISSHKPDLVILDLGLPDIDGKKVLEIIRDWSNTPVIICSARDNESEILKCLELGADDYITKPFNPNILIARIKANLRRALVAENGESTIKNGRVTINLLSHEVFVNDQKVSLTPREYEILKLFIKNKGKILTHKDILKEVWGKAHASGDYAQYIRVYVSQLRDKIETNPQDPELITTEPAIGYRMEIIE